MNNVNKKIEEEANKFFPGYVERTIDYFSLFEGKGLLTVHTYDETMSFKLWQSNDHFKPF